jgi:hypothetical protein
MTSGTGNCLITASQGGNDNYLAADDFARTVAAAKKAQTVTFTSTVPSSPVLGSTYGPTATGGGSGNAITFSASGGCAYNATSGLVTLTSVLYQCSVNANQAGNDNYLPGASNQTFGVIYAWTGFFQPIDNDPTCNSVKAGSAIPVKFNLGGNQGLSIFANGFPPSVGPGTCAGSVTDQVEETVTAGQSSLTYDATANQYVYVWKTDKLWAGQAKRLTIVLADGTIHYARFTFTK